ncbi:anti-sigma factor [Agrococcus sp. ProA11]|uniref:anti-sigma factor n=1 Tax=Agrococcus chionoecetis TaxID=3153752 RepID=UPI003261AC6F
MSGGDEMNGGDAMRERKSIDELAAAYALDALSPDERVRFEAEASPAARREAEELADIATLLATDAVAPPVSMRAGLLAAIAAEPQEVAEPADAQSDEAQPDNTELAAQRTAALAADAPSTEVTGAEALAAEPQDAEARAAGAPRHADSARGPGPAERRARARWRPMQLLGAVAAGAAILTGGIAIGTQLGADSQQQTLGAIVAAGDAQRSEVELEGGATATAIWSTELGQSVLLFEGLDPAPAGRNYQAWYIDGAGPRSAGVFQTAGGSTAVLLEGQLAAGDAVGVTVEPEGGSEAPTTDPILVVQT